jgi:hypothetical protein
MIVTRAILDGIIQHFDEMILHEQTLTILSHDVKIEDGTIDKEVEVIQITTGLVKVVRDKQDKEKYGHVFQVNTQGAGVHIIRPNQIIGVYRPDLVMLQEFGKGIAGTSDDGHAGG